MRKKLPKVFIVFFVTVFIIQLVALFFLLLTPQRAGAEDYKIYFKPQVGVSDAFQTGKDVRVDVDTVGEYISAIYQYGVGIVGIVAAVVMMFGGVLWLTAGGESGRVGEAKEWIKAALFGLILALLSYTILLTVNPDLINLQPIRVTPIIGSRDSQEQYQGYKKYCAGTVYNSSPQSSGGTTLAPAREQCKASCGTSGIAVGYSFVNTEDKLDVYPHLCCVCNSEPAGYSKNYAERYCQQKHGADLKFIGTHSINSNGNVDAVAAKLLGNVACDPRFPNAGVSSYTPYPAEAALPGTNLGDHTLICLYCN